MKKIGTPPEGKEGQLSKTIEKKAQRKHKAQQRPKNFWFGFGMSGIIGWLVAVPTLLGAGLGLWLDEHFPREMSQTLALMLAGLTLGCFNAWRWMEKERKKIRDNGDEDNE